MMIEMYEVINYEVVSKILNLLYSQNLHSFSPFFHPNSASNHPKITLFSPSFHLNSAQNHPPSPNSAQRVGWSILNQTPYPQ